MAPALTTGFNGPAAGAGAGTHSPQTRDEVESPSTSNGNALARFEFEPGRGNDGTKILMVEWEDDEGTRAVHGGWNVSWEGKSTVLPAADDHGSTKGRGQDRSQTQSQRSTSTVPLSNSTTDSAPTDTNTTSSVSNTASNSSNSIHRLYFLLPPGVPVPPLVTLVHRGTDKTAPTTTWRTNPLPAIFPPSLGASARAAGKKGVLHTIWAKKRLQALQAEIEAESRTNGEGVGLLMVLQERDWIESNFGVTARPVDGASAQPPLSPSSPRSPGGGRLMEKLKGLKLGTTDRELAAGGDDDDDDDRHASNPLSPESSDVAVSSFSLFKGGASPAALAAKPAQRVSQAQPQSHHQSQAQAQAQGPRVAAQVPPASVLAAQQQHQQEQMQSLGLGSLNALASGAAATGPGTARHAKESGSGADDREEKDDLFALPMSPRSPEMAKSPFSFAPRDTMAFVKGERVV